MFRKILYIVIILLIINVLNLINTYNYSLEKNKCYIILYNQAVIEENCREFFENDKWYEEMESESINEKAYNYQWL